jgi:hypothetical protein
MSDDARDGTDEQLATDVGSEGSDRIAFDSRPLPDDQIAEFCASAADLILEQVTILESPLPLPGKAGAIRKIKSIATDIKLVASKFDFTPPTQDCCTSCPGKYNACRRSGRTHTDCWNNVFLPCDGPCTHGC